jgi:hypothetical protein
MLGRLASIVVGVFVLQQVPMPMPAQAQGLLQPGGQDPSVRELLQRLRQIQTPRSGKAAVVAPAAATETRIVGDFAIVERQRSACRRVAELSCYVMDVVGGTSFDRRSTVPLVCDTAKKTCSARAHVFLSTENVDPAAKISCQGYVSESCVLPNFGEEFPVVTQSAGLGNVTVPQGGAPRVKFKGAI